jgi:quinone-modifying oxidoreductase subunit QmoC
MLLAQWGLADELAGDPAVWLCHQCNDCSVRCPRDAKPADVMQVIRSLTVEKLAVPKFMGSLVARAQSSWPVLVGVPILFWILLLAATGRFEHMAEIGPNAGWEHFVPHWMIYSVYFPVAGFVTLVTFSSGMRFWNLMGAQANRTGSFVGGLIHALTDIATHKRFGSCDTARPRRWAHFLLFWGFMGAAITSAFLIVVLYVPPFQEPIPLPLSHWIKILGNLSALALVVGGVWLWINRFQDGVRAGASTAFDKFFLYVVLAVIVTGCFVEAARFVLAPQIASWLYVLHLGVVLCLFLTFPYSKFAHLLYRTLAMVHERMSTPDEATN